MIYDKIPDDFPDKSLDSLAVTPIPRADDGHDFTSTRQRITDNEGREFLVISDDSRKDDMSDYIHVSQAKGELAISNPTLVATEMYPSGGDELAKRAVLTAMREFRANSVH